ncbi:hypothetical protein SDRG_17345 [Saprolegnia diclina VS20]|nr:hypothetical protein SDRG_17345 [Saprolegnia diclina VS20]EQC24764.1 hypothetical protein SDRG_17345 [Saprolegnia diclina VS20]|eukprot:XP_008621808.1 hypothetical protein SDRG_17345 [Saprolegnia diclina VS20]
MDLTGAKTSGTTATTLAHAMSPEALAGALDMLSIYTERYCAPVVQQFVAKAGRLLRHMMSESQVTAHTASYVARWFDWALECFRLDMANDVRGDAAVLTHWFSHEHLHTSSPMLVSMARSAQDSRILELMASQAKPQRSPKTKDGVAKDGTNRVSSSIKQLVPKLNKMELCLRYVSNKRCEGKQACKNPGQGQKRAHFTPSEPLDPSVIEYINESLGGLQKQFIQLDASA